jgi:hypothetical protein
VAAASLEAPGKASLASYASGSGADGGWQRYGLASDADECGSSCEGSIVDAGCVPVSSLLDSALLAMWEERAEQGLFRWVGGRLGWGEDSCRGRWCWVRGRGC